MEIATLETEFAKRVASLGTKAEARYHTVRARGAQTADEILEVHLGHHKFPRKHINSVEVVKLEERLATEVKGFDVLGAVKDGGLREFVHVCSYATLPYHKRRALGIEKLTVVIGTAFGEALALPLECDERQEYMRDLHVVMRRFGFTEEERSEIASWAQTGANSIEGPIGDLVKTSLETSKSPISLAMASLGVYSKADLERIIRSCKNWTRHAEIFSALE